MPYGKTCSDCGKFSDAKFDSSPSRPSYCKKRSPLHEKSKSSRKRF
ncbi:MAG: DNA-directed RNA polymerase [Thaumarchaeota archaeon]|nr:DNA-directed RNA polymerase [Nitrososphaerota archaeon]